LEQYAASGARARLDSIFSNRFFRKSLVAGSLLLISLLFFTKIFTSDYGIHLAVGRYVVENGEIPHKEFLVYPLLGQTMNYEEVGFQVILYGIYKVLGSFGVSLFTWSMGTLSFLFLYKALRVRGVRPYIILLTMLVFAFAFRIRLQPRPEVIVYFMTSFLLYGLALFYYGDNRKLIFTFPFLFLLWANIHPSTLMGLGIVGAHGTESLFILFRERFRKEALKKYLYVPLAVFGLCALGSMMSKHGADSILTPIRIITDPTVKEMTSELVSVKNSSFYLPYKYLLGMTVLFAAMGLLAFRVKLHDVILAFYGMRLPLQVARGMAFMSLLTVPLIASSVEGAIRKLEEHSRAAAEREKQEKAEQTAASARKSKKKKRKADVPGAGKLPGGSAGERFGKSLAGPARYVVVAVFIFVTGVGVLYQFHNTYDVVESGIGVTEHKFSFKATEFLKSQDIKGNMFNFFDLGGFLEWQLHPSQKLAFIDGRGASWGVFKDHQLVTSAMGGIEEVFSKHNITYVVTKAADSSGSVLPMIGYLTNSREWELVFADGLCLVYVRRIPENEAIIERHRLPKHRINEHIVHELIHYTYLGVNKSMVYSVVSNVYRGQGDLRSAQRFRDYALKVGRSPALVRAINWILS
jgi:hypothetical protein